MKGDFSRDSFDATKHFSQVLLQQGRVTLDADPNEQGAILLHLLRTLARDLIGPAGGPLDNLGFELTLTGSSGSQGLEVGAGRYYVDGILVENDVACDYGHQPDLTPPASDPVLQRLSGALAEDVWLYLDVWERHVSWIEDDTIREPALGGPDTCTRAQVVWQVRGLAVPALTALLKARLAVVDSRLAAGSLDTDQQAALQADHDRLTSDLQQLAATEQGLRANRCTAPLDALDGLSEAWMTARLDPGPAVQDACTVSPGSSYRGLENQLYRVEVHRGSAPGVTPTFKWSRDNGSVATRWLGTQGNDLLVTSSRGFDPGVWVELGDDSNDLNGMPGLMAKLVSVDGGRLTIDPASLPSGQTAAWTSALSNPKVRRWDQSATDAIALDAGAVPLVEATATLANWIDLEDSLQVQFAAGGQYRTGDYWLIPARVATGSIEWPNTVDGSGKITWQPQGPHGIEHHYASLGFLGSTNGVLGVVPCLCTLTPINSCAVKRRINLATDLASPATRPKAAAKAR